MVVISKESLQSKRSRLKRGVAALGRFLRFLCLASLIPSLFLLRWYVGVGQHDSHEEEELGLQDKTFGERSSSPTSTASSWREVLRDKLHWLQHHHHAHAHDYLDDTHVFDVLPTTLQNNNYRNNYLLASVSDVAELYYCTIDDLVSPQSPSFTNFTNWAKPLLNETLKSMRSATDGGMHVDLVQQEFVVELLELYAQLHNRCDYSKYAYAPFVDRHGAAAKLQQVQSQQISAVTDNKSMIRLCYTIIVHDDVSHLQRLLKAIVEPWHYIVLHVERLAPATLVNQVKQLANQYDNVVVVQFGTIVYKTDSVSMVNLRILQWLVNDLRLQYDYLITTGASVYPLVGNIGQALAERRDNRQVWLGETYLRGQAVYNDQSILLKHKRLIYTRGPTKIHKRLPRQPFAALRIPDEISLSMMYKMNSGNQGVYSYGVIQELLASVEVKQLFVMSKYACCCCLEERNWIAALDLIGYAQEAREQAAVFQVWGGVDATCKINMKNALLSRNTSLCYRTEDATLGRLLNVEFRGNETMRYLRDAKARGILFARKFRSDHEPSYDVLRLVEEEIW